MFSSYLPQSLHTGQTQARGGTEQEKARKTKNRWETEDGNREEEDDEFKNIKVIENEKLTGGQEEKKKDSRRMWESICFY